MKRFKPRSVIANLTRVAAISFLLFFVACSDDDSDSFLVKGDDTSYSSEDDEPESSSARSSSSSGRSSFSISNRTVANALTTSLDTVTSMVNFILGRRPWRFVLLVGSCRA